MQNHIRSYHVISSELVSQDMGRSVVLHQCIAVFEKECLPFHSFSVTRLFSHKFAIRLHAVTETRLLTASTRCSDVEHMVWPSKIS